MIDKNKQNEFHYKLGILVTESIAGLIIIIGVLLTIAILILLGLLEFPEFMLLLIGFICLWFIL